MEYRIYLSASGYGLSAMRRGFLVILKVSLVTRVLVISAVFGALLSCASLAKFCAVSFAIRLSPRRRSFASPCRPGFLATVVPVAGYGNTGGRSLFASSLAAIADFSHFAVCLFSARLNNACRYSGVSSSRRRRTVAAAAAAAVPFWFFDFRFRSSLLAFLRCLLGAIWFFRFVPIVLRRPAGCPIAAVILFNGSGAGGEFCSWFSNGVGNRASPSFCLLSFRGRVKKMVTATKCAWSRSSRPVARQSLNKSQY